MIVQKANMFRKEKTIGVQKALSSKELHAIIQEEGYFPHLESDGDVTFKIQGTSFTYGTCAKGFVYGRLYYRLRREDKWAAMLAAQCVELSYVAIKILVVPDSESLIFSVESLCQSADEFRGFFRRSLSILSDSVGAFSDYFKEYSADPECKEKEYEEIIRRCQGASDNTINS